MVHIGLSRPDERRTTVKRNTATNNKVSDPKVLDSTTSTLGTYRLRPHFLKTHHHTTAAPALADGRYAHTFRLHLLPIDKPLEAEVDLKEVRSSSPLSRLRHHHRSAGVAGSFVRRHKCWLEGKLEWCWAVEGLADELGRLSWYV